MITKFKIFESKNYGMLYHICDNEGIQYIIDDNILKGKNYYGVSFTRNRLMFGYIGSNATSIFKLELDGEMLTSNYKIYPISYKTKNAGYLKEYEEYCKTSKILNINKYITKIIINKKQLENLKISPRDKSKIGKFFSDIPNNIPSIIKKVKEYCMKYNIDIYFQNGIKIEKDEEYLNTLIDFKLHKEQYVYSLGYLENSVLYDIDKNHKIKDFYLGKIIHKDEFDFKIVDSEKDAIIISKNLNKDMLYIIKIEQVKYDDYEKEYPSYYIRKMNKVYDYKI